MQYKNSDIQIYANTSNVAINKQNEILVSFTVTHQFNLLSFRTNHLSSWLSVFIIIASEITTNADDFQRLYVPEVTAGYDIRGHVTNTRTPRSGPGISVAALKVLLKGATEAPTGNSIYRKFFKYGSESDAIADFEALNCKTVMDRNYGSLGYKGATRFKLMLDRWNPTIQINDHRMERPVKIVYSLYKPKE